MYGKSLALLSIFSFLISCGQQDNQKKSIKTPTSSRSDALGYIDSLGFKQLPITRTKEIKAAVDTLPPIQESSYLSGSLIIQNPVFVNKDAVYSEFRSGLYQAWQVKPNVESSAAGSSFKPLGGRTSVGMENQVVAVIDMGSLQVTHPDLAGKILEERNFIQSELATNPKGYADGFGVDGKQPKTCSDGALTFGDSSHGISVASVIAAQVNNGSNTMVGVAPNTKIRMYRVTEGCGLSSDLRYENPVFVRITDGIINNPKYAKYKTILEKAKTDSKDKIQSVASAINYSVDQGVDAINISLGTIILNPDGIEKAITIAPNLLQPMSSENRRYFTKYPCYLDEFKPIRDAIERAYNSKIPVFTGAGNYRIPAAYMTVASCPYVLSVGAVDSRGLLFSQPGAGSNYGTNVSFAVDTSNLFVLKPSISGSSYVLTPQAGLGTSYAAPVATGTYLLMKSVTSDAFKAANPAAYAFLMAGSAYHAISPSAAREGYVPCGAYLSFDFIKGWYTYFDPIKPVPIDTIDSEPISCGLGILNIYGAVNAANSF